MRPPPLLCFAKRSSGGMAELISLVRRLVLRSQMMYKSIGGGGSQITYTCSGEGGNPARGERSSNSVGAHCNVPLPIYLRHVMRSSSPVPPFFCQVHGTVSPPSHPGSLLRRARNDPRMNFPVPPFHG